MDKKKIFSLTQKTATIIGTALAALNSNNANSKEILSHSLDNRSNIENINPTVLKRKFVLKLNFVNPAESISSMHASHSSHSSHSSGSYTPGHSSHSSHSSHISSSTSPSYTPSNSTPTYTPSDPVPSSNPSTNSSSTSTIKKHTTTTHYKSVGLTKHTLGSRTASVNEEGTDIKEIQELLINKGYAIVATGYFDAKTVAAIKQFQKAHNLTPDGKVGTITLKLLQK